ncbi:Helix-turn-helix [Sporobacter termitidis DSM 10068]|uniref:Helix-turn-helix n=1 Tax=Sporobacter termitidis DSM 10068 TaxID=1123282 RepID=A0A1M5ZB39_9FIRM|nr:helix-turn-helix transcriptional regulator [Sporobacter termitidis]SHI21435.1 Helix-turn-helix [Sporobacter termitidis DSM 10068]
MNIADKIQNLRKIKGISQEELADKVGISRQAVSKWESAQSTPDIEKIILMSDYFEVTTDYLLKGIEPKKEEFKKKPDAGIFSITGTAFNFIGLIVSVMIWHEKQAASAVAAGLILMAIGCVSFAVGQTIGADETKVKAKRYYWLINLWALMFIPLSLCFNVLDGFFGGYTGLIAPYPLLGNSFVTYGLCWLAYFGICIAGDLILIKKGKAFGTKK